jgi:predicted RNase H-like HicB family nuclease
LKIKVVVHEAEEGGYWAEVPAIPGCATQGDTMEDLVANVHEAIEACLDVEVEPPEHSPSDRIMEIALRSRSPVRNLLALWKDTAGNSFEFAAANPFTENREVSCGLPFAFTETRR